jgi:ribosomal protein S12 methylthiotransferase
VGFPGETEDDVGVLLDFLEAAQLDRVGCFTYSAVDGAQANELPNPVDERDKLDRQERVYEIQSEISRARLDRFVGERMRILVDDVQGPGATGRTMFDAPEIDGVVHVSGASGVREGEFIWAEVSHHDDHDLFASFAGTSIDM